MTRKHPLLRSSPFVATTEKGIGQNPNNEISIVTPISVDRLAFWLTGY
jgi:hypothetical protein